MVNTHCIKKRNNDLKRERSQASIMSKVSKFINEVKHEVGETTWPTAKEMRKNTTSVFSIIVLFALFFYATESAIQWLLSLIMR